MASYFEARNVAFPDPRSTRLPPWFDRFMPKDRNARILDIGCGHGGMLSALARAGYANAEGVEIDEEAVSFCRRNGLKISSLDLLSSEALTLGKFDLIIMNHVLEHFPKDKIVEALRQIKNLLNPGGELYIAVPNAQSNTGSYWAFEDFTHSTLFTSGSLFYVAKMAGFQNVEFVDVDCLAGVRQPIAMARSVLLYFYRLNYEFWNRVTRSQFHSSVPIFSYEIKALIRP
jgi:SAM-dependent methyltransferase